MGGSGKSAIHNTLQGLGYKSFDIESIPGLFTMNNTKTCKPAKNFDINDLEFLKHSEWICDIEKLQQIIQENTTETNELIFYCGTATNSDELFSLFDKVFFLHVSDDVLRERLTARTTGFGSNPKVQEWIFSWKESAENNMLKLGAIKVNAERPLEDIAAEIIKISQ